MIFLGLFFLIFLRQEDGLSNITWVSVSVRYQVRRSDVRIYRWWST